jgi:hypothetical protein
MAMTRALSQSKIEIALRDQRGMITLDFIFALVVSIGFAIVFFSVAVTLSLVEVAQYVTFTTSRAYAGAHETKTQQEELARARFDEVMALPAFKTFLGQQWMKLGPPQVGDYSSEYPDDEAKDNNVFVGARIPIDARLLHLNIPFLGSTAEDSGVGKATLNSYLDREVSTTECREQFTRVRFQQLKSLSGAPYGAAPGDKDVLITDNGC